MTTEDRYYVSEIEGYSPGHRKDATKGTSFSLLDRAFAHRETVIDYSDASTGGVSVNVRRRIIEKECARLNRLDVEDLAS